MKTAFIILGSGIITISPLFSLIGFMLYGGESPTIDAICFVTFGLTCYCLAHLQSYVKHN
jgi:hypothetical protein